MATPTVDQYPQLISLAVHEFRTPLSVVGGYLRMLQRDGEAPLTDRQRKMIDEAEKSNARLVALIGELSDIGKLDAGLIAVSPKPLDLGALLDDVARHVLMPEDRDVRLTSRIDPSPTMINGDPTRLRTAFDGVFRSILREYAGPATIVGELRRAAVNGRDAAVVLVAEESALQDVHARSRVPFDEKRGGMGLTLPLARRVFEQHGGSLLAPAGDDRNARSSAIIVLPITE